MSIRAASAILTEFVTHSTPISLTHLPTLPATQTSTASGSIPTVATGPLLPNLLHALSSVTSPSWSPLSKREASTRNLLGLTFFPPLVYFTHSIMSSGAQALLCFSLTLEAKALKLPGDGAYSLNTLSVCSLPAWAAIGEAWSQARTGSHPQGTWVEMKEVPIIRGVLLLGIPSVLTPWQSSDIPLKEPPDRPSSLSAGV